MLPSRECSEPELRLPCCDLRPSGLREPAGFPPSAMGPRAGRFSVRWFSLLSPAQPAGFRTRLPVLRDGCQSGALSPMNTLRASLATARCYVVKTAAESTVKLPAVTSRPLFGLLSMHVVAHGLPPLLHWSGESHRISKEPQNPQGTRTRPETATAPPHWSHHSVDFARLRPQAGCWAPAALRGPLQSLCPLRRWHAGGRWDLQPLEHPARHTSRGTCQVEGLESRSTSAGAAPGGQASRESWQGTAACRPCAG